MGEKWASGNKGAEQEGNGPTVCCGCGLKENERGLEPSVGISYVVTKFATAPESMLVYYTITDTSASARIPL
jgi:hypothetical protein